MAKLYATNVVFGRASRGLDRVVIQCTLQLLLQSISVLLLPLLVRLLLLLLLLLSEVRPRPCSNPERRRIVEQKRNEQRQQTSIRK